MVCGVGVVLFSGAHRAAEWYGLWGILQCIPSEDIGDTGILWIAEV